jgi:hypothetical protein
VSAADDLEGVTFTEAPDFDRLIRPVTRQGVVRVRVLSDLLIQSGSWPSMNRGARVALLTRSAMRLVFRA